MLYLHTRQPAIIHRDLKSANLLVDAQWHVKVRGMVGRRSGVGAWLAVRGLNGGRAVPRAWPRHQRMPFAPGTSGAGRFSMPLRPWTPAPHHSALSPSPLLQIADFNLSRAMEREVMMSTICITNPRWGVGGVGVG